MGWYEEAQANNADFASYYKSGTTQLDLTNAKVQEELVKAMTFWAANGVDGFLVKEAQAIPSTCTLIKTFCLSTRPSPLLASNRSLTVTSRSSHVKRKDCALGLLSPSVQRLMVLTSRMP